MKFVGLIHLIGWQWMIRYVLLFKLSFDLLLERQRFRCVTVFDLFFFQPLSLSTNGKINDNYYVI